MRKYENPKAEIKNFVSENIITASGVSNSPLVAEKSKVFAVSEANVSWNSKVEK